MWNKIVNPLTGKKVGINSKAGLNILSKYLKQYSQNHIGGAEEKIEIDDNFKLSDYFDDDSDDGDDSQENINIIRLGIEQDIQKQKVLLELLRDEKGLELQRDRDEDEVRDCSLYLQQRIIEQEKKNKNKEKDIQKHKVLLELLRDEKERVVRDCSLYIQQRIIEQEEKNKNKEQDIQKQKVLLELLREEKELLELQRDEDEVLDCSLYLEQRIIEQEEKIINKEKEKKKIIGNYLNTDLNKFRKERHEQLKKKKEQQHKALLDKQQNKKVPIKNQQNLDDYLKKQSNKY
jgi:hypothetical protein